MSDEPVKVPWSKEKIIQTMKDIKAESDEIKPYVIVLQPRRDKSEIPAQRLDGYESLHFDCLGFSHAFVDIEGEKVDAARNWLADKAIESGAKYALWIGEDTVINYSGFLQLLETSRKYPGDMIVGQYWIKCSSIMVMEREENYIYPANIDLKREPFPVWQAGMDCALVEVRTLEIMKEKNPEMPLFCIGHPSIPGLEEIPFIGEDNWHYFLLRKSGFKVVCDPRVQALHCDLKSGLYSCHPDITPEFIKENYYTNFPMVGRLSMKDKAEIDKRWIERLPPSEKKEEIK